jgi:hypothetical protein
VQDVPLIDICLFTPCLPVLGDELRHELVPIYHGQS